MFAYCRNNPVRRVDISGAMDADCYDNDPLDEANILKGDLGGGVPVEVQQVLQGVSNSLSQSYTNTLSSPGNGTSYNSYSSMRSDLGPAGENHQWHHVVEQYQQAHSGFSVNTIQNTSNIVAIDTNDHRIISGFYSSKQFYTEGMTVRQWLSGHSYEFQREFGMAIMGG